VLADAAGNDTYDAMNYCQASSQHFGLAVLLDGGGDDRYNMTAFTTEHRVNLVALSHDYSVSWLIDDAGSDTYGGSDRSVGAGKCHGMGFLVDNGGDDRYVIDAEKGIGWATDYAKLEDDCGSSNTEPTYGFLVDVAGIDFYDKPNLGPVADGALWINDDLLDATALEYGAGLDTETAPSKIRAYGAAFSQTP